MKQLKLSSRLSAVAIALGLCASVNAYAIDYNINLTAAGGGTLTGTISTDGTLGAIDEGNITDFSLTWRYQNVVLALNRSNAYFTVNDYLGAQELQATASSLFMLNDPGAGYTRLDVSNGGHPFLAFGVYSPGSFDDWDGPVALQQMAYVAANGLLGSVAYETAYFADSGAQFTIGNAAVSAAVPEPAAFALMAVGLAGVAAAAWRRKAD